MWGYVIHLLPWILKLERVLTLFFSPKMWKIKGITWMITVNTPKGMGAKPKGLNPIERTKDNCINLRAGEVILLIEEHTSWFANAKWSSLKSCKQMIYRLRRLYLGLHTYRCANTYMHAEKKRSHVFEIE